MKTEQTVEKRAVEIAAVIMTRAGLCRYSSYDKCRRLGPVSERDCTRCIYELKMAAAAAIEKLLHLVFKAENKDRLCSYNDVVLCDWPEERPGRCRTCPCNPEQHERIERECEA